ARVALRAAPLADDEKPVRAGLPGGQYKPLTEAGIQQIHSAALDALETFTLVVVNSCTGDFLLGDAERTFGAHRFTFNGRAHAQLVLDWVRTNLPAPDDVILAGTAGGALGALVHADAVATMYPAARLSLVSDSFVAAQPPQFHGVYSDVWGACDAIPAALPDVRSDCQAG
ncbi:MAG: pectin acetylesterase-family hydrolase, partial [Anaerolineae bacterium]